MNSGAREFGIHSREMAHEGVDHHGIEIVLDKALLCDEVYAHSGWKHGVRESLVR